MSIQLDNLRLKQSAWDSQGYSPIDTISDENQKSTFIKRILKYRLFTALFFSDYSKRVSLKPLDIKE